MTVTNDPKDDALRQQIYDLGSAFYFMVQALSSDPLTAQTKKYYFTIDFTNDVSKCEEQ